MADCAEGCSSTLGLEATGYLEDMLLDSGVAEGNVCASSRQGRTTKIPKMGCSPVVAKGRRGQRDSAWAAVDGVRVFVAL